MFDAQCLACEVEGVGAGGCLALAGEAIGELTAVVGQQLNDLHRGGFMQTAQEIGAAPFTLVGVDAQEHPARCAVNGHEQVATAVLVRHLRQVLASRMQKPRGVVLESFLGCGLAVDFGEQIGQAGHAMAAQTPIQARPGDGRIDKFVRHDQQVIQGQPQRPPQFYHHEFLGGGQRGL
jgi:hypothetical protein